MPQMGPMVGYAVTVVIEPSNAAQPPTPTPGPNTANTWPACPGRNRRRAGPRQTARHRRVLGRGEQQCPSGVGCVGTITDGAIRDLDEMTNAGFKALAQRFCVGPRLHPVRWNCEVEVFGRTIGRASLSTPTSTVSWRPTRRRSRVAGSRPFHGRQRMRNRDRPL